jgi:UDP-N-acetylglucosamine diphosphorylase / glucose-1-phosphate thymidylyltransferase / UDP-N-acetylgalactosamine diphosphorylase / glucosamine-1-phosphate N-acetyltransferase / galactosamine-1-phosphate N-acetyltransferase
MRICLYEDRHVRGLEPLTLTRPTIDLLSGLTTLGEKHTRHFSATSVGHLCRPVVADLIRGRDPGAPVNNPTWLRGAPTILVNARWVPPPQPALSPRDRRRATSNNPFADGSHIGTVEGEIAYAVLDTRRLQALAPATLNDCLNDWAQSLPVREVGGTIVGRPWDLIDLNPVQISRDFESQFDPTAAGFHPTGFALVGPADRLFIHPTARIDPMVVADTTHGPVSIGPEAVIQAFTRLEGPCGIGAGSVLLGARVRAGTTIGPQCRIGGEIECSVVLGHANKYHEGFLGHSYIGEWVNLAAGTHTSDLRCDYEPVNVLLDGVEQSTGRTKVGAMIGDHAKTGLGVLLNCGTTIGPFAQVLPTGGFAPREIPAFTRAGPSGVKELGDEKRAMATANTVMKRRGKGLTPALEAVYRSVAATRRSGSAPSVLPMRRTA